MISEHQIVGIFVELQGIFLTKKNKMFFLFIITKIILGIYIEFVKKSIGI